MTFWYRSESVSVSADPYNWVTDPDPEQDPALSVRGFQVFCFLLFKGTFTSVFKDKKVIKKSQNSRNQGFSYFFLMMERSGPWSPKKHTDPDPQHCFFSRRRKDRENQKYNWPVGIWRICADIVPNQRIEDDGGQVPEQLTLAPQLLAGNSFFVDLNFDLYYVMDKPQFHLN